MGKRWPAWDETQSLQVYSTHDAQLLHRLVGHEQTVYRAIFSPDGHQLATVSADATLRLWDLDTGGELFSLRLPTHRVPLLPSGTSTSAAPPRVAGSPCRSPVASWRCMSLARFMTEQRWDSETLTLIDWWYRVSSSWRNKTGAMTRRASCAHPSRGRADAAGDHAPAPGHAHSDGALLRPGDTGKARHQCCHGELLPQLCPAPLRSGGCYRSGQGARAYPKLGVCAGGRRWGPGALSWTIHIRSDFPWGRSPLGTPSKDLTCLVPIDTVLAVACRYPHVGAITLPKEVEAWIPR